MKTIVMPGGNSGIGLEAARQLVQAGHRVVLIGRDRAKGAAAAASLTGPGTVEFRSADLSTHAGVRACAQEIAAACPQIDALVHTTGVLVMEEARTTDGLHPFFAVNYLSRYHLTQRLLPNLQASPDPRLVSMTSNVSLHATIDLADYPRFTPFSFRTMTEPIQIGNHHYAQHLRDAAPWLMAGVVNAGVARTDIWRVTPWYVRAVSAIVGPLMFDPIPRCAANPVALVTGPAWPTATWWPKVGRADVHTPLSLDPAVTAAVMAVSRDLTGI